MKATGIVRRIDDLGRVVIPKEIRRTMRIREGDPLEIYTDKDGEVIFKKYSMIGGLADFAVQICDSLHKATGHAAVVTDRDSVVAAAGVPRRELSGRRVSQELEQLMEKRQIYLRAEGRPALPVAEDSDKHTVAAAAPVLTGGDVIGCVLFIDGERPMGETEHKLLQTVSSFLGRQMAS